MVCFSAPPKMNDLEQLEKKVEKKFKTLDKKKKRRMKVSGKSVFILAKLIAKKPPRKKHP